MEVENHDDFYAFDGDWTVNVWDQRGVAIMYESAMTDLNELEHEMLMVASYYMRKVACRDRYGTCMYVHVHVACIYSVHVHVACIYSVHVHVACIYSVHVHVACIYSVHVHVACTHSVYIHMYMLHVVHVRTYMLYMHVAARSFTSRNQRIGIKMS